jgi:altered-inheritance-of-mitochondria protein 5
MGLYVHRANRNVQRTMLSQQAALLNSVVEPPPPQPDPPAYEVRKAGLVEGLKDRWNGEVERLVRRVEETDWSRQREIYEERVATVWAKLRSSEQAQQLQQNVKDAVTTAADSAKDATTKAAKSAKDTLTDTAQKVKDTASTTPTPTTKEPRLLELK